MAKAGTIHNEDSTTGYRLATTPCRPSGDVALLSIHPAYVELIQNGVKRVEFRRNRLAREVSCVVIYATSPIKRIVGICEVEQVVRDTPHNLWANHGANGGISREALLKYLTQLALATAIIIRKFHPFADNLDLRAIGVKKEPQSFQYLNAGALFKLRQHENTAVLLR